MDKSALPKDTTAMEFDIKCDLLPIQPWQLLSHWPINWLRAVVAERLEPRTSILEVHGLSPGLAVAPLGKALYILIA